MLSPQWRRRLIKLTQQRFTASAAVVVRNDAGRLLLLNHVLRHASGWGLPGGFVNRGENPAEAIRRELREEVGIELERLELYRVRTGGAHIEFIFTAKANEPGEVLTSEIFGLEWFLPTELPENFSRQQNHLIDAVFAVDS
ncbi:hypothetical protein BH24ACI3_BH24ACI3_02900 [soil metagenome]